MVPATVDWIVEEVGLQLYSARVTPAKGGPLLHAGANYPYTREKVAPLSYDESNSLRLKLKKQLLKSGYKSRVRPFIYEEDVDYNDFRLKVLLKAKDVDAEWYSELCRIWKYQRLSKRL